MVNSEINSFYYNASSGKLFCTIVGNISKSSECLIYLAPLFEERMWSQRIALNFSRLCWKKYELPTVIIDYRGYGESDGETEAFSLVGLWKDIDGLIFNLIKDYGVNNFHFWGIRTGAFLALYVYQKLHLANSLLLWVPVVDLQKYIYDQLRFSVVEQGILLKKVQASREDIFKETLELGQCKRDGYLLNHLNGFRIGGKFLKELIDVGMIDMESLSHSISIMVVNIIPPGRNPNRSKLVGTQEFDNSKIVHETVYSKYFWVHDLDFSQTADGVYEVSFSWLQERSFNEKPDGTDRIL